MDHAVGIVQFFGYRPALRFMDAQCLIEIAAGNKNIGDPAHGDGALAHLAEISKAKSMRNVSWKRAARGTWWKESHARGI